VLPVPGQGSPAAFFFSNTPIAVCSRSMAFSASLMAASQPLVFLLNLGLDICLNPRLKCFGMANQPYREAYDIAAKELDALLVEQERIEERILSLRKTMNALATLISQHGGKDKDFLDYAGAHLREVIDTSLTEDIHKIVATATQPLTASEVRAELKELGNGLAEQSNPLATIYAILNRLAESGRAHETVKDGKKAWERMSRMAEAFRKFSDTSPVYSSGMRGDEKPKPLGHSFKPGTYVDVSKKKE